MQPRTLSLICMIPAAFAAFAAFGAPQAEDILIADFEARDYGDWTVEGEAFGRGPAGGNPHGQAEGNAFNFQGRGLVNSYRGGDNKPTGILTSPEFTIERSYINLLVGGGDFDGVTCVNLLVEGDTVRTATGPSRKDGAGSKELLWHAWDVGELRGKTARIQIVDNRQDEWGHITVDHIVQSEQQAQNLLGIARDFVLDDKYLIFPVDDDSPSQVLDIMVDGEQVLQLGVELATGDADYWVFLDTAKYAGKKATLRAERLPSMQLDSFFAIRVDSTYPGKAELYMEKLRPQLHFSSKRGWNNDPNGLMYYGGEYHLFYQHNPYGWDSSLNDINKTWGHAVSADLVHWEELGDALFPDEYGTMYSGSGVVDWNNTTGFQKGEEPPLIAIYTSAGETNPWSGVGSRFTQGIAYSNDRGRTWTKYEGNPVQGHLSGMNRDPKVIWWEETNEWVIVLFLTDSRVAFFRSKDLKRWEQQSVFPSSGTIRDCPELFQLAVDGDEDNTKWILHGGYGEYFVGNFDGSKYTRDGEAIRYNYGNCFYAPQNFSDIPDDDGRRIQIAWGTNPSPGMPFNQMMNIPVVLTLHSTEDGLRMFANPVDEIEKLYLEEHEWKDLAIPAGVLPTPGVEGELFDIEAELVVGDAEELGLVIRGQELIYRVEDEQLVFGEERAPLKAVDGRISLRCIVDRTSIEIFANDGRVYMPCRLRAEDDDKSLALFARGGAARAASIQVRELESIWE